jgi:hypothetical protein
LTAKHVVIVFLGCATAIVGAWITIKAPSATGGLLVITLGGQLATGALALAMPGRAALPAPRPGSGEHTPLGR